MYPHRASQAAHDQAFAQASTTAALQGEATKPATCARINGSGVLEEGLLIQLGHPQVGGKPALFVGGFYVFRNNQFGAIYRRITSDSAIIRRAIIEEKKLEGRKPFPLLTQPDGPNPPLMLHVNPHLDLLPGVKLRQRFSYGIIATAKLLVEDSGEQLLSFEEEGQEAVIFYEDGRVSRVVRKNNAFQVPALSIEEQAVLRLKQLCQALDETQQIADMSERNRKRDWLLHQAVSIVSLGGSRSPEAFEAAATFLIDQAMLGRVRAESVRTRAEQALTGINRKKKWEFREACGLPTVFDSDSDDSASPTERKGPPPERRQRLQARSLADQQRRSQMRGSSAEKPLHPQSGKKKKGK